MFALEQTPRPKPVRLHANGRVSDHAMSCDHRAGLSGARILVVEDDAIQGMALCADLGRTGIDVVGPAGTPAQALRLVEMALRDGGLSAAVLDVNLCGTSVLPVADVLTALGVPFLSPPATAMASELTYIAPCRCL